MNQRARSTDCVQAASPSYGPMPFVRVAMDKRQTKSTRQRRLKWFVAALVTLLPAAIARAADENPFQGQVLDVRPRIFLRGDSFEGLTIDRLRDRLKEPEFAGVRAKWRSRPLGRGLLWLIDGRQEDLEGAVAGLQRMDAGGGSWSDRGLKLLRLAALFDWLYEDLDESARRAMIAKIEQSADAAVAHVRGGKAPFFYSRTPGALAGLCVAGLALDGVSDKAAGYLDTFRQFGVKEYFKAYQWVDGAATGATYTMSYTYVDLPAICAAWWSATDRNPADWIRTQQGDWLDDIVRFYLWYLRPGFAFTDINDQYRGDWQTHDQFCQGLDIASYVTRSGYGRAWSQRWAGRFGSALYHPEYGHNLMFRDAELDAKPLTDLPRAALFGRESCGYGFFRSEWPGEGRPDTATHVFFRCGDPMNVHGGVAAGEFQVFKYAPLAARGGRYSSYDSPPDQYHRNCISANVVLFTDPAVADDRGDQHSRRGLKWDHKTWAQWLEIRARNRLDVAQITDWQVREGQARCRANLTRTNPDTKCKEWIREFVWLDGGHLVVLDIVESARADIRRQWQLHSTNRPEVGNRVLTLTNQTPDLKWSEPGLKPANQEARLFCRTLIPNDYRVILHGDGKAAAYDSLGKPLGPAEGNRYHRDYGRHVAQIDPGNRSERTIFLHVLTATDARESAPPSASYRISRPGQIEVTVEEVTASLAVPDWFTRDP